MNQLSEEISIKDKKCICIKNGEPEYLLLNLTDERDGDSGLKIAEEISKISGKSFLYVAYIVNDWNRELSPWPHKAVFGKNDFKCEGKKTLDFIVGELLPEIRKRYGLDENLKMIIGGYSLAGLFSLWSAYNSDLFAAVAAVSPSVWYDGFTDYTRENKIKTANVYLSLGDREERAKNPTMAKVGNCIRELDLNYKDDPLVEHNILEWNPGNHFMDSMNRLTRGYVWCIRQV